MAKGESGQPLLIRKSFWNKDGRAVLERLCREEKKLAEIQMIVEAREVNQNMEESQVQKQIGPTDSHILTLTLKLTRKKSVKKELTFRATHKDPGIHTVLGFQDSAELNPK